MVERDGGLGEVLIHVMRFRGGLVLTMMMMYY